MNFSQPPLFFLKKLGGSPRGVAPISRFTSGVQAPSSVRYALRFFSSVSKKSRFLRYFREFRCVTWCLWTARAPRRTPRARVGAGCRNKRPRLGLRAVAFRSMLQVGTNTQTHKHAQARAHKHAHTRHARTHPRAHTTRARARPRTREHTHAHTRAHHAHTYTRAHTHARTHPRAHTTRARGCCSLRPNKKRCSLACSCDPSTHTRRSPHPLTTSPPTTTLSHPRWVQLKGDTAGAVIALKGVGVGIAEIRLEYSSG